MAAGMSNNQKPSPCRIVFFQEEGGPYPAMITKVNEDGSCELTTFGPNSIYFQHGVKQAEDLQDGGQATIKGTWTWPPRV
jgi:hypothetical protein